MSIEDGLDNEEEIKIEGETKKGVSFGSVWDKIILYFARGF